MTLDEVEPLLSVKRNKQLSSNLEGWILKKSMQLEGWGMSPFASKKVHSRILITDKAKETKTVDTNTIKYSTVNSFTVWKGRAKMIIQYNYQDMQVS